MFQKDHTLLFYVDLISGEKTSFLMKILPTWYSMGWNSRTCQCWTFGCPRTTPSSPSQIVKVRLLSIFHYLIDLHLSLNAFLMFLSFWNCCYWLHELPKASTFLLWKSHIWLRWWKIDFYHFNIFSLVQLHARLARWCNHCQENSHSALYN